MNSFPRTSCALSRPRQLLCTAAAETDPRRRATISADSVARRQVGSQALSLQSRAQCCASFDVSLGLMPNGPEAARRRLPHAGRPVLPRERNVDSDYFLSIQVSYPNERTASVRARRRRRPGRPDHDPRLAERAASTTCAAIRTTDWTDGCIAVSNSDMVDIWLMTRESTPIEIRP